MEIEKKIKKGDVINVDKLPSRVQHPYEITKNYIFSIHETRVFARVLQRLKIHQNLNFKAGPNLFNMVKLTFNVADLTVSNDYAEVKNALEDLRYKNVKIDTVLFNGEKGYLSTGLIASFEYAFNNSVVDIELSNKWYEFLLNGIGYGYTSYLAQTSFEMSNEYYYNMYLYISHWYKKDKIDGQRFTVEQLRKVFKVPVDLHVRNANFIEYVLKPCKENLDKVADKSFNYQLIRKVEGATRGKGAEIIAIDIKFYDTNFQLNQEASIIYDAKRAKRFIDFCGRLYKLEELDKARLGAFVKKYGQDWVGAIEKEERGYLKKQKDFVNSIASIVHSRVKG